ncbi:hypothetical protein JCM11641_003686 [Rhodosporidiobolus odoratus]
MKLSYSDSVKPFLHKPGSAYTRALDPHLLACTEKISQKALGSYDGPLAREPWDRDLNRLYKWQELGQQKREVILLQIWQTIHEGLEKASYVMAPTEIPEWDLEKLASANGLRMLELVALTRAPPAFDPATDPVPHFSHGDWDRLWCVGKHGPAVPFSCAKRAFTESAVALRSATLLNFVQVWKMVVVRPFLLPSSTMLSTLTGHQRSATPGYRCYSSV